jgi:putative hydrolase of the HAD superfamily
MTTADAGHGAPTGLLIDFGGVLTNTMPDMLGAFCAAMGLPLDAVGVATADDGPLVHRRNAYECGELTDDEFLPELAHALGVTRDDLRRLFDGLTLDEAMVAAVRRARASGIRTGLLSNSWGTEVYPRPLLAELFHDVVISAEVGLRKPGPEIYALAAQRLGVAPGACVFVDDTAANLAPAEAAGMATVHHVDAAATIAALEGTFGVPLRA